MKFAWGELFQGLFEVVDLKVAVLVLDLMGFLGVLGF